MSERLMPHPIAMPPAENHTRIYVIPEAQLLAILREALALPPGTKLPRCWRDTNDLDPTSGMALYVAAEHTSFDEVVGMTRAPRIPAKRKAPASERRKVGVA